MELGQRAERLAAELIAPLLTGGTVRLQSPFGSALCGEIGPHRAIVDPDLKHTITLARTQAARRLTPIDLLPELSTAEWSLAAALNDLLQATNHELSGFATRGHHNELCEQVSNVAKQLAPVATLGDAICRHATFGRILQLERHDTEVSWWTGSQTFRGQAPSKRLLLWRNVRNVRTTTNRVDFQLLANDLKHVDQAVFGSAVNLWIGSSPLTDLACAHRRFPAFVWTPSAISIIATRDGHNLALRAIKHHGVGVEHLPQLLHNAADATLSPPSKNIAQAFAGELAAAVQQWFGQQEGSSAPGKSSDSAQLSP